MQSFDLPYYNERPQGTKIDTLVIHCSAHNTEDMMEALIKNQVSTHYIIGLDGKVVSVIPEAKRAWHAGISFWRGVENLNNSSIGIEVSSLSMGQDDYSPQQTAALLELCQDIIKRYGIAARNVVAHSDIATTRKPDPGVAFPWQYLAQNGIGLWYDLQDAKSVKENNLITLLAQIGYDISNPNAAAYAFCRHFIPQAVKKETDIHKLISQPYTPDFVAEPKYSDIFKACAVAYNR